MFSNVLKFCLKMLTTSKQIVNLFSISFMARLMFRSFPLFYPSTLSSILHTFLSDLLTHNGLPILVKLLGTILGIYFRFCGLSPRTFDLDDRTTVHFWTADQRRPDKPDLVMVHGYGGDSIWQFLGQVGPLSKAFNLHLPDLLFFGKSYTKWPDWSEVFQAKCVVEGLRRIGVGRYALYGISYGGFVAYQMAAMCPQEVEKVVIVSSGIVWTEDQKRELLIRNGRNALEILLPETPNDLRLLVSLSVYKSDPFKWVPDFILTKFVQAMMQYRKEKLELIEHLLNKSAYYSTVAIIPQPTLLIWGDKDNVFPLYLGYQLHRHLGGNSKLEILKDTGHAANLDSPDTLNELIKSFVLNGS